MIPRIETVVFIHAFAWIFLLASVIPSAILGKGRSVLLQFFLCLTLTLVAVSVEAVFTFILGADTRMEVQALSGVFMNPVIASLYLSAPYVLMLYLDIRSRRENVEEEFLDPYPHALVRLRAVGRNDVTGKEVSRVEERMLRERPEHL